MNKLLICVIFIFSHVSIFGINYKIENIILKEAKYNNLDPNLIKAVIRAESGFNKKAVSTADAHGLMQLIPATAKRFHVEDIYNPAQNIRGGASYLAWLINKFDGNVKFALAGYNAGENAVIRYKGIPPYKETQKYVKKVLRFWSSYSKKSSTLLVKKSYKKHSKAYVKLEKTIKFKEKLLISALKEKLKKEREFRAKRNRIIALRKARKIKKEQTLVAQNRAKKQLPKKQAIRQVAHHKKIAPKRVVTKPSYQYALNNKRVKSFSLTASVSSGRVRSYSVGSF